VKKKQSKIMRPLEAFKKTPKQATPVVKYVQCNLTQPVLRLHDLPERLKVSMKKEESQKKNYARYE